jgi:hypothetical protein
MATAGRPTASGRDAVRPQLQGARTAFRAADPLSFCVWGSPDVSVLGFLQAFRWRSHDRCARHDKDRGPACSRLDSLRKRASVVYGGIGEVQTSRQRIETS